MSARLLCKWGEMTGSEFPIGREATIGRSAANNIRLASSAVSGEHARIVFDEDAGRYRLEDLGSLNGTELDGTPVTRPEPLGRAHVIDFGGAGEFLFLSAPSAADEPSGEPSAKPDGQEPPTDRTIVDRVTPVLPETLADGAAEGTRVDKGGLALPAGLAERVAATAAPPATRRFAVEFAGTGERFTLGEGKNEVGRSRRCRVRIDSPDVSRHHAVFTIAAGAVRLEDLGSRNHTFVEGERIEGEVVVEHGARVRFGTLEARLVVADPEPGESADGED